MARIFHMRMNRKNDRNSYFKFMLGRSSGFRNRIQGTVESETVRSQGQGTVQSETVRSQSQGLFKLNSTCKFKAILEKFMRTGLK